jgi:putative Holliday junction resolvase
VVVVGMPFSLDGTEGPAVRRTRREVEELERALSVPIETYDERLTTVTAERSLMGAELDGRRRREVVDKVAAAVMLQSWLDHRRANPHDRAGEHEEPG